MSVTQPLNTRHTAVLLPGTGSDDVFVRSVFKAPLAVVGVPVVTPVPVPGPDLVGAHLAALDEAAAAGPIIAGGISLGAHLAASWAARNPARCAGLLLALPGWCGAADGAPAALAATYSAADVRARGTTAALASAVRGVAPWLAEELTRAWTAYGDGLADSLEAAAACPAPTSEQLAGLDVPTGIAACTDDPVHPAEVARTWAAALPTAELCSTRLEIIGADPAALGRAAVLGWLRARLRY
ncbi:alpha/beta fold hydrolase [Actinokineospora iranica]|uniref:alpha/beta fold hydrolase n=1 Tax=Actinokineospora iranica TaxID=1271860 RepID=UPI000B885FD2|nr:alpha/beta hydrolase [Actinokineospora iranica]